jgi:tellurite resistance protein
VKVDDTKLREALQSLHQGPLTPTDAAAIIDVARFAASVDGRMDLKEMATVARLSKIIYALTGTSEPSVPSTPVTKEWMVEVGKKLTAQSVRELAFAAAYVIVLADGKVTSEETALGAQLTNALRISTARMTVITEMIDGLVSR